MGLFQKITGSAMGKAVNLLIPIINNSLSQQTNDAFTLHKVSLDTVQKAISIELNPAGEKELLLITLKDVAILKVADAYVFTIASISSSKLWIERIVKVALEKNGGQFPLPPKHNLALKSFKFLTGF